MLDQVPLACPFLPGGFDQPGHRLPLVVAGEDQRLLGGLGAVEVLDLLLIQVQEAAQDDQPGILLE